MWRRHTPSTSDLQVLGECACIHVCIYYVLCSMEGMHVEDVNAVAHHK